MFFEDITPTQKLHEILCHASPDLSVEWLGATLRRLAGCELALENAGISEEAVRGFENESRASVMVDSFAIDAMATILSQNG